MSSELLGPRMIDAIMDQDSRNLDQIADELRDNATTEFEHGQVLGIEAGLRVCQNRESAAEELVRIVRAPRTQWLAVCLVLEEFDSWRGGAAFRRFFGSVLGAVTEEPVVTELSLLRARYVAQTDNNAEALTRFEEAFELGVDMSEGMHACWLRALRHAKRFDEVTERLRAQIERGDNEEDAWKALFSIALETKNHRLATEAAKHCRPANGDGAGLVSRLSQVLAAGHTELAMVVRGQLEAEAHGWPVTLGGAICAAYDGETRRAVDLAWEAFDVALALPRTGDHRWGCERCHATDIVAARLVELTDTAPNDNALFEEVTARLLSSARPPGALFSRLQKRKPIALTADWFFLVSLGAESTEYAYTTEHWVHAASAHEAAALASELEWQCGASRLRILSVETLCDIEPLERPAVDSRDNHVKIVENLDSLEGDWVRGASNN